MARARRVVKREPWAKAWYDPRSPDAFGGIRRLLRRYPKHRKRIQEWSQKQEAYTLHKLPRRRFPRRQILVPFTDFQTEADLADMSAYSDMNDGTKFLLFSIDRLSRLLHVRPLRNKSGPAVARELDDIFQQRRPWKLLTDRGKEWENRHVRAVCEHWDVQHYFCRDPVIHCPMVERAIRTIKSRIARHATATNSRRYIDTLQYIVRGYNHSVHSVIGMRPVDVTRGEKEAQAYANMLRWRRQRKSGERQAPLKEGDRVRLVLPFRAPFDKGYDLSWTRQIYTVAQRLVTPGHPDLYRLRDDLGCQQPLGYYREEVQKVIDPDEYAVERVLRSRIDPDTGRRQYLVRWAGYQPDFDSWVEQVWRPRTSSM